MPGRFCCGAADEGAGSGGAGWCWCVSGDWCAYLCVGFVYLSLAVIDVITSALCIVPMYGLDSPRGIAHMVFFQTIVFMVALCHVTAAHSDPGLVPRDTTNGGYLKVFEHRLALAQKKDGGDPDEIRRIKKSFCRKCFVPKPKGTHHCSTCNRCVRQMDHHCPWVNSCVGERNLKAFVLFLVYVWIGTGYAMVMMCLRTYQIVVNPLPGDRNPMGSRNAQIALIAVAILAFVMAIFFFAFVMCMCYDQYEAFTTGVPGIDAMNMHEDDLVKKQSFLEGCRKMVVHEDSLSWRWFVPTPPVLFKPMPPKYPFPTLPPAEKEEEEEQSSVSSSQSHEKNDATNESAAMAAGVVGDDDGDDAYPATKKDN